MQSYIRATESQEKVVTNNSEPTRNAQVVVVGAGLAGLAAAQRLFEAGIEDVIVLDAQDRIGGRVHTINHSDYLLELGAQWLHGAEENPLYDWLAEKNMLDDFEDATAGFSGMFCNQNGQVINQRLVDRVINIMMESKLSLSKDRHSIEKSNGDIASNVFRYKLDLAIENDEELKINREVIYSIFDWFLGYETIDNCCDSMNEVSTASYTDWTDWGDGTLLNFKQGYRSLLFWFCNHIPTRKWIYLNKEVVNIEALKPLSNGWCNEEGQLFNKPLLIKFLDTGKRKSSNNDEKLATDSSKNKLHHQVGGIIECEHVIVTASLGFLKQNHKTLFTPQLPLVKRELIDAIGFGTVNKIILQFESPFWDSKQLGIKLVWNHKNSDKEIVYNETKGDFPEWVKDIVAFDVVRKQPNLLLGWIGGLGAKLVEEESDKSIGDTCLRVLDQFLPVDHRKPTKLIASVCSRWYSNPFTRGSYSFQSVKSFNLKVEKLAEPIYNNTLSQGSTTTKNHLLSSSTSRIPRILFAGEATAGKLYSTTHGAIISGWREAERLRDIMSARMRANIQVDNSNQNLLAIS